MSYDTKRNPNPTWRLRATSHRAEEMRTELIKVTQELEESRKEKEPTPPINYQLCPNPSQETKPPHPDASKFKFPDFEPELRLQAYVGATEEIQRLQVHAEALGDLPHALALRIVEEP